MLSNRVSVKPFYQIIQSFMTMRSQKGGLIGNWFGF